MYKEIGTRIERIKRIKTDKKLELERGLDG